MVCRAFITEVEAKLVPWTDFSRWLKVLLFVELQMDRKRFKEVEFKEGGAFFTARDKMAKFENNRVVHELAVERVEVKKGV